MGDSFGAKVYLQTKVALAPWVELGEVIEGDFAKLKKTVTERKHLGQANRYVKKRGTFLDGGSMTFKVEFEKPKLTLLKSWLEEPDAWNIRVEVPDITHATNVSRFKCEHTTDKTIGGILEDMGQPLSADGGRLETDITVAISGRPEFEESVAATTVS
jgi:hypothetical protein